MPRVPGRRAIKIATPVPHESAGVPSEWPCQVLSRLFVSSGSAFERGVRPPGVPYPVAPQAANEQLVRLQLHRRPIRPAGDGEGRCAHAQDVAARPGLHAEQHQLGPERAGQQLPECHVTARLRHGARLDMAKVIRTLCQRHRSRWNDVRRRFTGPLGSSRPSRRASSSSSGSPRSRSPGKLTRQQGPRALGDATHLTADTLRSALGARRVCREARGNGSWIIPAMRSRATQRSPDICIGGRRLWLALSTC